MKKENAELRHNLDELDRPLRQQLKDLLAQARAILDKATRGKRDLTGDELEEYRRLMGEDERGTSGEIGNLVRCIQAEDAAKQGEIVKNSSVLRSMARHGIFKVMVRSDFETLSAKEKMTFLKAGGSLIDV